MPPSDGQPEQEGESAIIRLLERRREQSCTALAAGTESVVVASVHCPPQEYWPLFVKGASPKAPELADLSHAAGCDYCGPLLLAALEGREMQAVLRALPSARPRVQARLARQLARPKPGGPVPPLWPPRWAYTLAALVAIMIAIAWWYRAQPASPATLLAQAYTRQRTLDFRIAGAAYAPLAVRRGPSQQPATSLLEAEAAIARGLERNPDDPGLLALRGRAEILDLRYGAAITDLTAALNRQPDNPAVMTDLASAYFEREEQTGRAADFEPALEYLGRALAKNPGDPLALYNRALMEEQFPMPVQAAEDWAAYLKVDASSPWATEARQHLDAVKKK